MHKFNLIFSGEIAHKFDLSEVKQNFKNHFHLSDIQLEYIFSGKEIILKKNLSEKEVLKFAMSIDDMGGVSYFEPADEAIDLPDGVTQDRRENQRRKRSERRKVFRAGISADRRVHSERRKKD